MDAAIIEDFGTFWSILEHFWADFSLEFGEFCIIDDNFHDF